MPEVRRLLLALAEHGARRAHRLRWSRWRRAHQARANRCHAARRAHERAYKRYRLWSDTGLWERILSVLGSATDRGATDVLL